jgi:hypothetical protein
MAGKTGGYNRFYAALNALPGIKDKEEFKRAMVAEFTKNRTDSLKEMTAKEYGECCRTLETMAGFANIRKKKRSACLKLMQQLGIDTTDWARVNDFCRHPKIAGREFAKLGVDDLDKLQRKLRAIERNGGLRKESGQSGEPVVYKVTLSNAEEA